MKQLSGRAVRSMLESAPHCLCLPCLALAFPDSPMNAVAVLSPLLCSSASSSIWVKSAPWVSAHPSPTPLLLLHHQIHLGNLPPHSATSEDKIPLRWLLNFLGNQVGSRRQEADEKSWKHLSFIPPTYIKSAWSFPRSTTVFWVSCASALFTTSHEIFPECFQGIIPGVWLCQYCRISFLVLQVKIILFLR